MDWPSGQLTDTSCHQGVKFKIKICFREIANKFFFIFFSFFSPSKLIKFTCFMALLYVHQTLSIKLVRRCTHVNELCSEIPFMKTL